ncbi:probable BOI-related E3 ubiquitin-protein ligase 3 [Cynara cardunculus var. scolymus]|uniref:Zinc finger, RING-type n=1 Tax=Cynara cardunculus var. scolymus TaxID=59895 RepID=A0A103YJH9_CYNCS|nr:probable BOI-related E3 ubiquitin-protein ligase 3 [Cynara cardunculus var. scolymus]KVI10227.1 Zinc finger, RING-type [Cynara cardunculus var. scolymus]
MAVEAPPHSHLFSPQFLSNREMIDQGNKNVYGNDAKFGYGMAQMENGMFPMYVSNGMMDTVPAVALKADSGLTYSLPISRKRSRESSSFDPSGLSFPNAQFVDQNQVMNNQKGVFTFLGQDVSMQIYQQQMEIDRFIANHTEKVRSEIEATRRRNSMRLIAAAEEGINKRLRSKEEEIIKIGKLNSVLEEKVKSLSVENQIWQQMAQTNEATANALRRNLHRILTQIQQQQQNGWADKTTVDDVQSCCGSNYDEEHHHHQPAPLTAEGVTVTTTKKLNEGNDVDSQYCRSSSSSDNNGRKLKRWCRNCGKMESCVLLLPCRHLCICSVCESAINVCPICKSSKNASVHVNMS